MKTTGLAVNNIHTFSYHCQQFTLIILLFGTCSSLLLGEPSPMDLSSYA